MSGIVGLDVSSEAGCLRGSGDGGSRDTRSGFIEDIAGETSSGLAVHGRRDHQRENADNHEKYYFNGILYRLSLPPISDTSCQPSCVS